MKIVRNGGTTVLPKGKNSTDICDALLLMDPNDKNCWEGKDKPKQAVVEWLVAIIQHKPTVTLNKADIAAVHAAIQPIKEGAAS